MIAPCYPFDLSINEKTNKFRFINIEKETEVKSIVEVVDVLNNFSKVILLEMECIGDQDYTYPISKQEVTKIILNKTNEIYSLLKRLNLFDIDHPQGAEQQLVKKLCNQIYEFTMQRIGIQTLHIDGAKLILERLTLKDSSRLMKTSKYFYAFLSPIILKKYESIKSASLERNCLIL